ncbi:MAG TPA: hypothetical protein VH643_32730 [Gemmataceae bacterium]|jgi:hypothetical protein
MPDTCSLQGLSAVPDPGQPDVLKKGNDSILVNGDAGTRLTSVLCQIDELRRLNKRIELDNRGLVAHNRALQTRLARFEAQVAHLEARVGSQRYRLIDRVYRITQRVPLLTRVSKFLLLKAGKTARRLRSWLAV